MRLLTSLVLLGLLTSFARAQGTKPDIYGTASKVKASDDDAKKHGILGSMFVEAPTDAKYAYGKAFVRMTTKTKFQKQNGKLVEDAKFEDIKNGMKLSIWFDGPVAESDPVQATAGTVLIFPK
jgi:Protein of unknown function (DUF3221)